MSKELGALETNIQNDAHPELHALRSHLQHILEDMSRYAPVIFKPPILDSSYDSAKESGQESVPGIRALRDAIKQDLEVLEKVYERCCCFSLTCPYIELTVSPSVVPR